MSYDDRREGLIASAVTHIHNDIAMPVDLLEALDEAGVNINWLFKEAASIIENSYYEE